MSYINNIEGGNSVYTSCIEANPCETCRDAIYCISEISDTCFNDLCNSAQSYVMDCIDNEHTPDIDYLQELERGGRYDALDYYSLSVHDN